MTPRELVYWLQGAFEITGLKTLSAEQTACVKSHLNLTLLCAPEGGPFVHWLQGALLERESLDERQTEIIRKRLSDVFLHVIDPSYSGDPEVQAELQDVHDGVDADELHERVSKIESGPQAVDGPGIDPLMPLSAERLKELEAAIQAAQETATKALNRQARRGRGPGETRMMC